VFVSDRSGTRAIWQMDIDGNNPRQLTRGRGDSAPSLSPDGKWNQGKAQLTLNCRDYLDPRSRFWSDDLIGNLLGNYSHWIAGLTVSAWNGRVVTWYGQLILLGVGAVFSNLIYDLLKYVVKMIFFSEGK
jgi:hypothetical protein